MQPFKKAQYDYAYVYGPGTSKLDAEIWMRSSYSPKDLLLECARSEWQLKQNTLDQMYCSKKAPNDYSEADEEGEKVKDWDLRMQ